MEWSRFENEPESRPRAEQKKIFLKYIKLEIYDSVDNEPHRFEERVVDAMGIWGYPIYANHSGT